MKAGVVFLIVADIIKVFMNMGLLLSDGTFVKPNAQQDALLISQVNGVLKNHGLTEPVQVDAIIALLPLIFQIVGLK
jgi:hypothetical protein